MYPSESCVSVLRSVSDETNTYEPFDAIAVENLFSVTANRSYIFLQLMYILIIPQTQTQKTPV